MVIKENFIEARVFYNFMSLLKVVFDITTLWVGLIVGVIASFQMGYKKLYLPWNWV